jgi:hypothetical protein
MKRNTSTADRAEWQANPFLAGLALTETSMFNVIQVLGSVSGGRYVERLS